MGTWTLRGNDYIKPGLGFKLFRVSGGKDCKKRWAYTILQIPEAQPII